MAQAMACSKPVCCHEVSHRIGCHCP